jgi:hypothetical protein
VTRETRDSLWLWRTFHHPASPERLTPITTVTLSSVPQNAAPSIGTMVPFLFATPLNRAYSPSLFPCITGTSNAELIPGVARWLLAIIVIEERNLSCEFFVPWMGLNARSGGSKHSKRSPVVNRRL